MNSSDFGNLLKCYPWDISRRINANPSIAPICNISGVSFDWEFLISSSFVDCKVIIQDWLLARRSTLRPDEDTFSDLQIPPVDQEFKRKILARTVLFEQNKYYDMLAMAYLYFAGIYEEETDLLAAFCAQKQTEDAQADRERSAADSNGLAPVRFPDWPTLARWLKGCVADVHRSAPAWAGGLAQSRSVPSTGGAHAGRGPSSFAGSRPGSQSMGPNGGMRNGGVGPSAQGRKRQRDSDQQATAAGSDEEDRSDGEGAEERERKRERSHYLHLDHQHLQMQYQRQQLQLQQHRQQQQQQPQAMAQQQQQRPPFPSAPGTFVANGNGGQARPFLTTNAAAAYQNATQKHAQRTAQLHHHQQQQQLQQQQQQLQQRQQAFPSLYRQPPHPSAAGGASAPHFPPLQSLGGGGEHFAAEMPAWLAPFSANKELVMNLPRDAVFNYRPPNHSSFGSPPSGPAAGVGAEEAQLVNGNRGPQVGGGIGPGQANQSNGHLQPASAARTGSTGSSSNVSGAPANGEVNKVSNGAAAASQNGASKDQFNPAPYLGPVSEHNLLGNMPLSQQDGELKRPLHSSQRLGQQMYKPSSVASGLSSLQGGGGPSFHPLNSALTQQLLLQQQQLQSQQTSQQLAVNRRQKKNRDKFKVTFMLSPAKAAELQRTHGLLPDAPVNPSIANIGGMLNSNFSSSGKSQGTDGAAPANGHAHSNGNGSSTGKAAVKEKDVPFSVLVPLKGIDVLANGRYRVQLNTFMSGRKKFSRNSTDLYEALWIFEIALLISDTPLLLSELQRIGNYNCLAPLGHLGFFCSPREYYLELGRHILLFYDTVDFFNEDLITIAIQNYNAMRPAVAVMPPGMHDPQLQLRQKQSQASGLPLALPLAVSASGSAGGEDGSSVGAGSETDEEDRLYNSLLTNNAAHNGASVGKEVVNTSSNASSVSVTSRAEEAVDLPWMGGFAFGLCLFEQQLSCLVCLRTLPQPKHLPRISMVKEEKFTAAQIHQQLQQQQQLTTGTSASAGGTGASASAGQAGSNSGKHAPFSLVNPSHLN